MEAIFPFFSRKDFEGVPSSQVQRPRKQFEAAVDRAVGDRVRSDGAYGADLWSALVDVEWHGPDGEAVSYSSRTAGDLVAWVREEGDYIQWFCGDEPGVVVSWISDALATEGWSYALLR
ncbi:MAG: hypothetical protein ACTHM0_01055 [Sphingomonas sp.]